MFVTLYDQAAEAVEVNDLLERGQLPISLIGNLKSRWTVSALIAKVPGLFFINIS
jgi:hypothetical protein